METEEKSQPIIGYNDPALSFIKLKKIRMGDEVLERYQQKLLEIRDKYRAEEATNDAFSFYHDDSEDESRPPDKASFKRPSDNIFAYFLFHPIANQFNETNDWFLYWDPNLECENNANLNWDLSRIEQVPDSKTKQIGLAIKRELMDAGFGKYFKEQTKKPENKYAFDDFDDDEYYDHVAHKCSSYDSDDSDHDTHAQMHYYNHPDPESYPRDSYDNFD